MRRTHWPFIGVLLAVVGIGLSPMLIAELPNKVIYLLTRGGNGIAVSLLGTNLNFGSPVNVNDVIIFNGSDWTNGPVVASSTNSTLGVSTNSTTINDTATRINFLNSPTVTWRGTNASGTANIYPVATGDFIGGDVYANYGFLDTLWVTNGAQTYDGSYAYAFNTNNVPTGLISRELATNIINAIGGENPAGASTMAQFNDVGSFGAISNLIYLKSNGTILFTNNIGSGAVDFVGPVIFDGTTLLNSGFRANNDSFFTLDLYAEGAVFANNGIFTNGVLNSAATYTYKFDTNNAPGNLVAREHVTNIVNAIAGSGSTNFNVLAAGTLVASNHLYVGSAQDFDIFVSGGTFQLNNPVSGASALSVDTSTDAVTLGSAGTTPSVTIPELLITASNNILGHLNVGSIVSTNGFITTDASPYTFANSTNGPTGLASRQIVTNIATALAGSGSTNNVTTGTGYATVSNLLSIATGGMVRYQSNVVIQQYPMNVASGGPRTNEGSYQWAKLGINTNWAGPQMSTNDVGITISIEGGGFWFTNNGVAYPTRSSGITTVTYTPEGGLTNVITDYLTSALFAANISDFGSNVTTAIPDMDDVTNVVLAVAGSTTAAGGSGAIQFAEGTSFAGTNDLTGNGFSLVYNRSNGTVLNYIGPTTFSNGLGVAFSRDAGSSFYTNWVTPLGFSAFSDTDSLPYFDFSLNSLSVWRIWTNYDIIPSFGGPSIGSAANTVSNVFTRTTLATNIAFLSSGSSVYQKAASTNTVTTTNLLGTVELAFASTLFIDGSPNLGAQRWVVTNYMNTNLWLVFTNTAPGIEYRVVVPGNTNTGPNYTVTLTNASSTHFVDMNNFGVAITNALVRTLTNGNVMEINNAVDKFFTSTNRNLVVTRQATF